MGLTFQEKSLWVQLVGLVLSFTFYFRTALGSVLPVGGENVMPHQVVLFILAVVLLVITQVAGHIVVAIVDRRAETDERDRLIEGKGERIGSYVLVTGVFFTLCTAVMSKGNFLVAHVLLASWVTAQLVEIGSQLFYRRGA